LLILKTNILFILPSNIGSTYGGGQVYFINLVEAFLLKGIKFEIACPGESNEGESKGVKVHYFDPNNCEASIKHLLTQLKPEVIHAHGFKGEFSKVGHDFNIPVVITAHHGGIVCPAGALLNHNDEICQVKASQGNCLPCVLKNIRGGIHSYPLLRLMPVQKAINLSHWVKDKPFIPYFSPVLGARASIQKKLEDWVNIVNYSSQMIAPSHAIAAAMICNGYPENKLRVIPHGIPLPEGWESNKTENTKLQLFYLGRINRVKGLHVLCESVQSISANFDLHIYGNAVTKEEKRYQLLLKKKYQRDNRIHWQGGVPSDKVFEVISKMDAMIHPTICMEIFGLNIAETLALGIPVIATRCGGAEIQIEDGVNGLLVEPNNVDKLAKAIQDIIENKYKFKVDKNKVIPIEKHVDDLIKVYEKVSH
jgi:glycosyltransferase involved in cell wall biosynthesis